MGLVLIWWSACLFLGQLLYCYFISALHLETRKSAIFFLLFFSLKIDLIFQNLFLFIWLYPSVFLFYLTHISLLFEIMYLLTYIFSVLKGRLNISNRSPLLLLQCLNPNNEYFLVSYCYTIYSLKI